MKNSKKIRKEQRDWFETEKKRKTADKHKLRQLANEEKRKRENIVNSKFKCKHCGECISYRSRRGHLRIFHQIFTDDPKPHFLSLKQVREQEREKRLQKYIESLSTPEGRKKDGYRCGDKVNGAPFVNIIYNSTETNRRKH